jgi:hypothetical protein
MKPGFSMREPLLTMARPGARALVESYFIKANNPVRREALWVKYTFLLRPGRDRSRASVWAIHFDGEAGRNRAFKQSWPVDTVKWTTDDLSLSFGDCELTAGRARGRLCDDEGSISWDLRFTDGGPALVLYPKALMVAPLPKFKLASPMPDAVFEGRYSIDGEEGSADGFKGMLGHNWGPKHNDRYGWLHANLFEGHTGTVFEAGCASLRIAGVRTPMFTTVTLRHQGRTHELHSILDLGNRRSDLSYYRWFFSVNEPPVRIEGVVQTVAQDLVGLYYDNPDGTMTYCLNSKIAHLKLFLYEEGCPDVVLSSHAAAFEMGTTDPHHGVVMVV